MLNRKNNNNNNNCSSNLPTYYIVQLVSLKHPDYSLAMTLYLKGPLLMILALQRTEISATKIRWLILQQI